MGHVGGSQMGLKVTGDERTKDQTARKLGSEIFQQD